MFHTPLLRSTNLDFNCKKRKKVDRFFCTPLVMKFDERAGYEGNSQRANQDCFRAHTSEDSCDGDSTDARYQIGPARQPPHVAWPQITKMIGQLSHHVGFCKLLSLQA